MNMTDIEIAESVVPQNIVDVAKQLDIDESNLELYGKLKAKIADFSYNPKGKLILVTAINPTPAGEGKTTVSIGLADGLKEIGKKVCLALREPSLGPVFGLKGGATGGGYSQVVPMADINLHFTGDFHAITSANNLLCSFVDNHIYQGNELNIDASKVVFNRCMDLNERALRTVQVCLGKNNGTPREDGFNITAASEIMAILCLSADLMDLKERLGNILVAYTVEGKPVYAKDLHAEDAMTILLKDAIKPNLVQTLAGTPALVHGGPFANIAHGCNTIIATKFALTKADYVVTEAGFGADLGAQKFLDTKCRIAGLKPNAVVVVATIKALKLHGGADKTTLSTENVEAVKLGLNNLLKHIDNIKNVYHLPVVVAINQYSSDTEKEIAVVTEAVENVGVKAIVADVWGQGGKGAVELAKEVVELCNLDNSTFTYSYKLTDSVKEKIEKIATKIYGATGVTYSDKAVEDLKAIEGLHKDNLPVIIAKTQYSLSDDATKLNAPKDFKINIREIQIRNGAGFIVAIAGKMLLMPGLPKVPAGSKMTIDSDNKITGLF
ncbi:MAG: formate--tetrahydrofolate ligase [Clostridia bacterium]|nr:formate--tetrahydrofolate ligase [Clostridia bacterium]